MKAWDTNLLTPSWLVPSHLRKLSHSWWAEESTFIDFSKRPWVVYKHLVQTNICDNCIQFNASVTSLYECLAFNVLALEKRGPKKEDIILVPKDFNLIEHRMLDIPQTLSWCLYFAQKYCL